MFSTVIIISVDLEFINHIKIIDKNNNNQVGVTLKNPSAKKEFRIVT